MNSKTIKIIVKIVIALLPIVIVKELVELENGEGKQAASK